MVCVKTLNSDDNTTSCINCTSVLQCWYTSELHTLGYLGRQKISQAFDCHLIDMRRCEDQVSAYYRHTTVVDIGPSKHDDTWTTLDASNPEREATGAAPESFPESTRRARLGAFIVPGRSALVANARPFNGQGLQGSFRLLPTPLRGSLLREPLATPVLALVDLSGASRRHLTVALSRQSNQTLFIN